MRAKPAQLDFTVSAACIPPDPLGSRFHYFFFKSTVYLLLFFFAPFSAFISVAVILAPPLSSAEREVAAPLAPAARWQSLAAMRWHLRDRRPSGCS
jgi:hypothetical protein